MPDVTLPAAAAPMPAGLAEPSFDDNAMRVLKERYLARTASGGQENPTEFLWRVASSIAQPERPYAERLGRDADAVVDGVAHAFYDLLCRRDFLPNTPCLVNAGRPLSMLSACFVLPVPDSIEGIFYNLKAMALIQKSGGGTGFAFSELRHQGALVQSTGKDASGPVSFMKVFNAATDSIKQGGVRRGANMGVLRVDHPDIFHFMRCKKELDAENRALWNRFGDTGKYTEAQLAHLKQELLQTQINNFNVSVGVTNAFMDAVKSDGDFGLIDPLTRETVRTVRAREIWEAIVEGAWQNGEPGVLFLDHPDANPLPGLGPIQATNPCVTADTWIATAAGARKVGELVGMPFSATVDGANYPSTEAGFFFTGIKNVRRVKTAPGFEIKATDDHPVLVQDAQGERDWKRVGELALGDAIVVHDHAGAEWTGAGSFDEGWLLGSLQRDGRLPVGERADLQYWGESARAMAEIAIDRLRSTTGARTDRRGTAVLDRDIESVSSRGVTDLATRFGLKALAKRVTCEIEGGSSAFTRGFLQGWFDADGTLHRDAAGAPSVRLAADLDDLRAAQRMLARLGVLSAIVSGEAAQTGAGYAARLCRPEHELRIGGTSLRRFAHVVGFGETTKAQRLATLLDGAETLAAEAYLAPVSAIEELGALPVFDCTIPGIHAFDANGLYVHNCGEQFLHGYDSCNLGSINVGHFYDPVRGDVDWDRLGDVVKLSIRFLDNVIDANLYPLDEIREMVTNNRRVGLGVMGFAELLIHLEIAYGSPESVAFAEKLMRFIQDHAIDASELLAKERGDFPNKHLSTWAGDARPRRNAALLSVAPTGTISMIAGCSFGCEPYFGMAYTKHVMKDAEGRAQRLFYVIPLFEKVARDEGFFSDDLLARIEENRGSVRGLPAVPEKWQRVFTVAADVTVDQHIDMLAAFQKHTCNAVSKTINAPNDDTRENVGRAIFRAFESGCKGFTYYRDGSRTEQVVTFSRDSDLDKSSAEKADAAAAPAPTAVAAGTQSAAEIDDEMTALLAKASSVLGAR